MKYLIFGLAIKMLRWVMGCRFIVVYRHKGLVRGFTVCVDKWYADKVQNIRKTK